MRLCPLVRSIVLLALVVSCTARLRIRGRLNCGRDRERAAPVKLYGQTSRCQELLAETQTKHNGVYDLILTNVTFTNYTNYFLTVNYSCNARSTGRMLWILFLPKDLLEYKLFFVGVWNLRVRPGPLTLNPDIVSECSPDEGEDELEDNEAQLVTKPKTKKKKEEDETLPPQANEEAQHKNDAQKRRVGKKNKEQASDNEVRKA